MAVVQISRIQLRRGRSNQGTGIPQLSAAELAWALDSQELYIGNGAISDGAPFVGNTRVLTELDIGASGVAGRAPVTTHANIAITDTARELEGALSISKLLTSTYACIEYIIELEAPSSTVVRRGRIDITIGKDGNLPKGSLSDNYSFSDNHNAVTELEFSVTLTNSTATLNYINPNQDGLPGKIAYTVEYT